MTDEENAAIAWLDQYAESLGSFRGHARTIKAMLAQPRLPEEPTPEMVEAIMLKIWGVRMGGSVNAKELAADAYGALYAHLTKPAPTLYRIRAKGLDIIHEGPVSVLEVPK